VLQPALVVVECGLVAVACARECGGEQRGWWAGGVGLVVVVVEGGLVAVVG